MRGIMMARTKPLKVVEPDAVAPLTDIVAFELPKPRAACKFADPENPAQLIEMLQNEAKIL
jgi:electron transfer flavoprotein beta subunit